MLHENNWYSHTRWIATEMRQDNAVPDGGMDDFLSLRENPEVMRYFCDNFLLQVVGKVQWRDGVTKFKVRDLATATDEAFALLVLENIWDVWTELPVEKLKKAPIGDDGKRVVRPGKYTNKWQSAKRFEGWEAEGLERMNELVEMVRENRNENKEWDGKFLEEKQEEALGGKRKWKRVGSKDAAVVVKDDFGEESDG